MGHLANAGARPGTHSTDVYLVLGITVTDLY